MTEKYKVLIADDDVDHVTYIRAILERFGYEPLEAFNGQETLRVIERSRPDLVLLDISMPKLDGLDVIRRLKSDPATKDLPVIMLSANSGTLEIRESFRHGASNYLIKPVDTERLVEKIEATLKSARYRENLQKRAHGSREAAGRQGDSGLHDVPALHRLASLAGSVSQFLSAVDRPIEELQERLEELAGSPLTEREVRMMSRKLDAIAALCDELSEFTGEAGGPPEEGERSDRDERRSEKQNWAHRR